jgi:general nucleoside transport system ATP-binding protein
MVQQVGPQTSQPPLIAMRGITKAFPGVLANDSVNLDVYSAEIHALLGENGAGKSTLMKILYGFYRADSGTILLNGKPISIQSPHDARAVRMGMVFQDFTLIPAFTVAENMALFLPDLGAVVDIDRINRHINDLSARYDLRVDPQAMVSQLSVGQQQKVEILKLLLADARLLILDEPTRVLAPHEVQALFRVLDRLRNDGYAIILITHKLKEVLDCADRITVLRGGRAAGTLARAEAGESQLLGMMFGKEAVALQVTRQPSQERGSPLLEVRGVETRSQGAEPSLGAIDLEISSGEIVGVAGVSGNGQKELTELLLGMIPCARGTKLLFGSDVTNLSVRELRRRGVGFIPENPLTMATAPFMTVLENMAVPQARRYARWGGLRLDWPAVTRDVEEGLRRFGFSFSLYVPARSLSGGNLQRMVIVREMMHKPRLIIASYLTRGLDAHSTTAARQSLVQARDGGAGVLLISEDLEELFLLSDRLVVLFGGRIVGAFRPGETDIYRVGQLMTGAEA